MDAVVESPDLATIYEVPLSLKRQKLDDVILELLGIEAPEPDLTAWTDMVRRVQHPASGEARIVFDPETKTANIVLARDLANS